MVFTPFVKKTITIVNVFSLVASQALFANGIIIDQTQTSNNPHLTQSDNHTDIINIAKPNQAGISNNFYQEFNVSKEGLILNNILSQEVMGNSQLAGYIYSNPNLDSATAKLILNQVTGGNISQLLGYLEIAGDKADMLLANPNGITCQGCGFINAGNVTLSTGLLSKEELERLNALKEYNSSTLLHLNIKRGDILVDTLDARNVASLTILAKTMNVKDTLQAQNLRILLGSNQVSFSPLTLLYQPIKLENAEEKTAFALDVAYLGSILSNKIFIVATDEGVGIKNAGMIASVASQNAGDSGFVIKANGEIEIAQPTDITTITQLDTLQKTADSNLTNTESSIQSNQVIFAPMLYAEGNMDIQAQSLVNNSIIHAQGDINIWADSILNKGYAEIEKKVISIEKFYSRNPFVNGYFGASTDSTYRYDIVTSQEYINEQTYSPSILLGNNITIHAQDFTNDTGIIYAKGDFNNYATNFANVNPELREIISYENGTKETYDRYMNCNWFSWLSKDWFCDGGYRTSTFTRASEYSLIDFSAPDVNLANIETNATQSLITLLDTPMQPVIQTQGYADNYQAFTTTNAFYTHLKNTGLQYVGNNTTFTPYIIPNSVLTERGQKTENAVLDSYKQKLENLASQNINLQSGITAQNVHIYATNAVNSANLVSQRDLLIDSDFIINDNGNIVATEGLNLKADSIKQNGGSLKADTINMNAKDIEIASSTFSNTANQQQSLTFMGKVFGNKITDSTSNNATLGSQAKLQANNINIFGQDTLIKGADISAQNNVAIQSDMLKLDTTTTQKSYADSATSQKETNNIATSITGNNIALQTKGDMNLVSANLNAGDTLALQSQGNIVMDTAQDTSYSKMQKTDVENALWSNSKKQLFSSTTTTKTIENYQATNLSNNLNAKTIQIDSTKDIIANNLSSSADTIAMNAGENLTLSNKADISQDISNTTEKTSGIGVIFNKQQVGISIGSDTTKTNVNTQNNIHNNTALNAQNVAMNANNAINIQSSDINASESATLQGKNVAVSALDNTTKTDTTTEFTSNRFGITFNTGDVKAVGQYAGETILQDMAIAADDTYKTDFASKVNPKPVENVGMQIGFTHINTTTTENIFQTQAASSNITADSLNIQAQSDTNIVGSNLTGNNIALSGENVNITAKEQNKNTQKNEETHQVYVGVGLSLGKDTNINVSADYNQDTTNKTTYDTTHQSSNLQAQNLSIQTQNDTNIIGSNLNTTNTDITAKNLTLGNATDTTSTSESSQNISVGFGITYNGAYGVEANGSYRQSNSDSLKTSSQSSIFNTQNLNIQTQNDTNIIGSNLAVSNQATIQANNFNTLQATDTQSSNKFAWNVGGGFSTSSFNFSLNGGVENTQNSTTTNTASNLDFKTLDIQTWGDTNIVGSSVSAKDTTITTNNFNLIASKDTESNKAWSADAKMGISDNPTLQVNGKYETDSSTTYNNASLAAENLNLSAQGNANLIGGSIQSNTTNINIGGNLNIESKQNMQEQFGASLNLGTQNNHFEFSTGYTNNVTNQSGIAGGLLNLNVAQDTTLNGAYIEGDKNSLFSTNSLTHSNINNSSFYMQAEFGKIPGVGSDSGVTQSTINQDITLEANNADSITRSDRINEQAIDQSKVVPQRNEKVNEVLLNPKETFIKEAKNLSEDVTGKVLNATLDSAGAKIPKQDKVVATTQKLIGNEVESSLKETLK